VGIEDRTLVTAEPELAEEYTWEAAEGAGLIILCLGLDALSNALDHLYQVRLNDGVRRRRSIADERARRTDPNPPDRLELSLGEC
jgi:hypothetical protein